MTITGFLATLGKLRFATDRNLLKLVLLIVLGFVAIIALVIFIVIAGFLNIVFSNSGEETYTPNIEFSEGLGILSEKYESSGEPGIIANNDGDIGGKSYGAWQIATNVGSMKAFLDWLKRKDEGLYSKLEGAKKRDNGYGKNFDAEWKKIAKENRKYFYQVQWEFIKKTHYDPVVEYFKKEIDFTKRTWTLRNVVWSTAVQHGVGDVRKGAIFIIVKQDLGLSENLGDDEELINGIYEERKKVNVHFSSSSHEIKVSVYNRFIQEKEDAFEMLKQELEKGEDNE